MDGEPKPTLDAGASAQGAVLSLFQGRVGERPPVWLMRQAGRYLPEYRKVRAHAGSFLDLCYNPELATEVTLQPIRRYGFDAAILFSDILVVPDALGQRVTFEEGEGPRLEPIESGAGIARLQPAGAMAHLAPVFEAVARIRAALAPETALFGFCGAPWTVASYMVAGRGTPDQAPARLWAYRDAEGFGALIDLLVAVSADYLSRQVEAGADLLQIFDSWAGSLPDDEFERWVVLPTRRIVAKVKARHPNVPIIGFPRGAGPLYRHYAEATGVDGVSCDTSLPIAHMRDVVSGEGDGHGKHGGERAKSGAGAPVVQGNLDPLLLVSGGEAMDVRVKGIVEAMRGRRFIFNLGHGIVPQTPPEHVARLVQLVRGEG